jgi:hypothetical protein
MIFPKKFTSSPRAVPQHLRSIRNAVADWFGLITPSVMATIRRITRERDATLLI